MTDIEYLADNFDRMYLGLTEALDQGPLTEEAFWREFEVAIADDHDIFTQVGMSGINQATGNKKEFYQLCIKQMENPAATRISNITGTNRSTGDTTTRYSSFSPRT